LSKHYLIIVRLDGSDCRSCSLTYNISIVEYQKLAIVLYFLVAFLRFYNHKYSKNIYI